MKKVIVLGGGMMGHVMAQELSRDQDYDLTMADFSEKNLESAKKDCPNIKTIQVDLSKAGEAAKLVKGFDLVVGALPMALAYSTSVEILSSGVDMVDISGLAYSYRTDEERKAMDDAAAQGGGTLCLGIGLEPGMVNVLTAHAVTKMDTALKAELRLGGLPIVREQPYEYKLVFSCADTLGQFVLPVKTIKDHKLKIVEACSEVKNVEVEGLGTLEAFTSNGLTSLIYTYADIIPDMQVMTMRYPGHVEKMRLLRDSGLLSHDYIDYKGAHFRPVDFTGDMLTPTWRLQPGEGELTAIFCDIKGVKDGKGVNYHYECLDYYDEETGYTSMARTTTFPALVMAKLITDGKFKYSGGLCYPEYIGRDEDAYNALVAGLAAKGVSYKEVVSEVEL
ncbi:MAG: saccharopine dehydrogenase C-terminal domain-containing protein [Oscillospiraceae bacterium]